MIPKLIDMPSTSLQWRAVRHKILLIYILLGLLYASVTPIFEISDEVNHYPVVDYIATHHALPIQDTHRTHAWDWEAAQPPLYYVTAALLIAPFDRSDLYTHHWIKNPHAQVGIPNTTHNRNVMVHDWEKQSFLWRGTPLHVRIVRLYSLVLSAGTVWLIFVIGRQLAPKAPSLAAMMMALTAFNPMFIAIGASVNNDNMVTFFTTLAIALSFSIWRDGFTWARVWALAFVCVLASASKLSGTYAFVIAGLSITYTVYKQRLPLRQLILAGLVFALLWGALLGWWYIRNWQLYDDPLGNTHMARTVGLRTPSISIWELLREEWFSFYVAYWGGFGLLTFTAPPILFYYTGALIGVAILGGGLYTLRLKSLQIIEEKVPFFLLMFLLTLGVGSVISWSLLTPASQGRLLFPYNAAIVALLATGIHYILQPRFALLVTMPLMLLAFYCGVWTIPRAFALPPSIDTLPNDAQRIDVTFDNVGLLAVAVDDTPVTRAAPYLDVTLYWHTERTERPLSYFVVIYGRDQNGDLLPLGKRDSYPVYGLLSTTQWQPNKIYAETISIHLDQWYSTLDLPLQPRLHIGMRDHEQDITIQARSAIGETISDVFVNGGRIIDNQAPKVQQLAAEFVNVARLYDVQIQRVENTLHIQTYWEPLRQQPEDWTVFVQLVDPNFPQQIIASGDSPPRQGWWPTSSWIPHLIFFDQYLLDIANVSSGEYSIFIGLYHPETFRRIPIKNGLYPDAYEHVITIP